MVVRQRSLRALAGRCCVHRRGAPLALQGDCRRAAADEHCMPNAPAHMALNEIVQHASAALAAAPGTVSPLPLPLTPAILLTGAGSKLCAQLCAARDCFRPCCYLTSVPHFSVRGTCGACRPPPGGQSGTSCAAVCQLTNARPAI